MSHADAIIAGALGCQERNAEIAALKARVAELERELATALEWMQKLIDVAPTTAEVEGVVDDYERALKKGTDK